MAKPVVKKVVAAKPAPQLVRGKPGRPEPKQHPVFVLTSPAEFGRARAALVKAGITGKPQEALIGKRAGDLTKSEVARRIIAL